MDEASARARRAEEAEIDRVRRSARRLADWGRTYDSEKFARRARNMEKRVDRMEAEKTFVSPGSPLSLELSLGATRSRQALAIDGLEVGVADRRLFTIDELVVRPGERVALLGHNGVGKSTFIRTLVAALRAEDPRIRFSPQTVLGYYDQELDEVDGSESVIGFAVRRTDRQEQAVRQALIHAGFPFAEHGKRVGELSGGERARLLFLVLSLNAPNFLVLDEPTNHIDIDGKEALEAELLDSRATVLITSHDRHFLTTVANRFLLIEDGLLVEEPGPERFFAGGRPGGEEAPAAARSTPRGAARVTREEGAGAPDPDGSEEAVLARIVELEGLLEADRARKPHHQKPALQAAWQEELGALYDRLD
jgi:ATPase subunit of ABC transporter with duplicated ATPase domains